MFAKQYIVYDLEGNEVTRGTRKELKEQNIIKESIALGVYADTNTILLKKYRVKSNGKVERISATKQKELDRPKFRTVYQITDCETGEEKFAGTLSQVETTEYCEYRNRLAMYACRNHKMGGKYFVKIVGSLSEKDGKIYPYHPPKRPTPKVKPSKPLTELEYLTMHLKMYGNTFTRIDPQQYYEDLKNEGIKIDVRKLKDRRGTGYLISRV